jgi:hypothetical protein
MKPRLDAWVVLLVACRTRADTAPPDPPRAAIAEASVPYVVLGMVPLQPDGGWMQVWDENGEHIHVAVPTGATSPRPIVIGVHGAQDRPDWACAEWFGALAGFAFVICPRGVPYADGFVWTSAEAIVRGIERSLAAAKARFGPWMADGPVLYGGWSQASSLAFAVLPAKPELFDAAVLVEIGHTPVDPGAIAAAGKKLRGMAVVCATGSCEKWADGAREPMKRAGTRYETWTAGHRGHTFDGEVSKRVSDAVGWITASDPRWAR